MSTELKKNALSFVDTVTLAIAGSAPSYSLNASTVALIAAVGMASPAALILGAVPMFGISFAFKYLNLWRPDAGAAYAWVGRSIHPMLGFVAAWTFLVLSSVFMVTAALPVGVLTLNLVAPQLQENVAAAALVGGAWFTGVALLTVLGVHVAASFQKFMTLLEAVVLVGLGVMAVVRFSASPANAFSLAWFSPSAFTDFDTFMAGMLVAVFYYFGWDVSSNVAEEAEGAGESGGSSGVYGMVGVMLLYVAITVAVQMSLSADTVAAMAESGASPLSALADALLPHPWGNLAILAVILSTVGTIETQITQCARLLFSMGRDRVLHTRFAEIHPRFQTPWLAGLAIWGISIALIVATCTSDSIGEVMTSLISAIGIMVSIYYGLTGLACVWFYRRVLTASPGNLVMRGVWPLLSAVFLLFLGVKQLPDLGMDVALLTLGALAVGIVPMLYFRARYGASFYQDPLEAHPAA